MPEARRPAGLASVARTLTRIGRPRRRVPDTLTIARGSVASWRRTRGAVAVVWPRRSVATTRHRCTPSARPGTVAPGCVRPGAARPAPLVPAAGRPRHRRPGLRRRRDAPAVDLERVAQRAP